MLFWEPPSKEAGKKYFPFGLLILTITYIIVFFTLQFDDYKYRKESIKFYFESNLDKIEFPLYVRFVQKHMRDEIYFNILENISNKNLTNTQMYWIQRTDPFFQECLNTDNCLSPSSLIYLKWQKDRREYLRTMTKDGFEQFGFKTAKPSWFNIISSIFIHANIFQFLTNLVSLLMIGALIEVKIGAIGLILGYLLGGAILTSIMCLLSPLSLLSVTGASGGIACLIGILMSQLSFSTTRMYYLYFPYIRYIEVRSILVLLVWMLMQAILLLFTPLDLIDILSQIVSLVSGMIFGALIYAYKLKKKSIRIGSGERSDLQTRLTNAVKEISLLNYAGAKKILYKLLDEYPTSKEVHMQLFNLTKLNPSSEEYHQAAQRIFALKDASKATTMMINLVFKNYIRRAQPAIRFDVGLFLNLLRRFRKEGHFEDAEKILKLFIKNNIDNNLSEVLAREQLLLARCYLIRNDKVQAYRLLEWLLAAFPETESAKQAKNFANVKGSSRMS